MTMKRFKFTELVIKFDVEGKDGKSETQEKKIPSIALLKGALAFTKQGQGIDYRGQFTRQEIETEVMNAFKANKEKYPFFVVFDKNLATKLQEIVKDVEWVRYGDDIIQFLRLIDSPEDVEIKNGKVVKAKG